MEDDLDAGHRHRAPVARQPLGQRPHHEPQAADVGDGPGSTTEGRDNPDELLRRQATPGFWADSISNEYGTAMALIILQMPNNYLPIFQP